MKKLTIATTVILFAAGCFQSHTNVDAPTAHHLKPIALVVTHDVSKTFDHVSAPTALQLRTWAIVVASTGGTIAFGLIGDPDSTGALVRVRFLLPPSKPKAPTYLDQIQYNQALDSIEELNQKRLEIFLTDCLAIIQTTPPQQHTDLNGRLRDAAIFFNEPGNERLLPIFFTTSDGWQDVQLPSKVDTVLQTNLLSARVQTLCCKWKNPILLPNSREIESPAALGEALETFIIQ